MSTDASLVAPPVPAAPDLEPPLPPAPVEVPAPPAPPAPGPVTPAPLLAPPVPLAPPFPLETPLPELPEVPTFDAPAVPVPLLVLSDPEVSLTQEKQNAVMNTKMGVRNGVIASLCVGGRSFVWKMRAPVHVSKKAGHKPCCSNRR